MVLVVEVGHGDQKHDYGDNGRDKENGVQRFGRHLMELGLKQVLVGQLVDRLDFVEVRRFVLNGLHEIHAFVEVLEIGEVFNVFLLVTFDELVPFSDRVFRYLSLRVDKVNLEVNFGIRFHHALGFERNPNISDFLVKKRLYVRLTLVRVDPRLIFRI